jgi:hypothetical protein
MKKTIYLLTGALLLSFGVALAQSSVGESIGDQQAGVCCKDVGKTCQHPTHGPFEDSTWFEGKTSCS